MMTVKIINSLKHQEVPKREFLREDGNLEIYLIKNLFNFKIALEYEAFENILII